MESKLGLQFKTEGSAFADAASPHCDGGIEGSNCFGPEDVFYYAYAVFHSPTYRERYAEFLKIDFPRLPLTSDVNLFGKLVKLGAELVSLHLMKSPKLAEYMTTYDVEVDDESLNGLVSKTGRYPKYVEKKAAKYYHQQTAVFRRRTSRNLGLSYRWLSGLAQVAERPARTETVL